MRIIVPGSKDYLKFFSSACKQGDLLTFSRYILKRETEDGTLLCNTMTGELVILSDEEEDLFNKLPLPYNPASKSMVNLIRNRFIVPIDCVENRSVDQLRALLQKRQETTNIIRRYSILPTTCCNARCFYCFESDFRHVTMSEETAERLVRYIAEHHGGKPIKLSWFGGEPTIGKSRIDQICSKLKELAIDYHSDMVSNGYLFDDDLVRHAKTIWNLKNIQITLDGTEKVYNQTKAYVGVSDNPYQRVLRNISLFLENGISIDLRLNMDKHNAEDLSDLIEELSARFGNAKKLFVYVRKLNADVGFSPIRHGESDKDYLNSALIRLQARLEECGWIQYKAARLPKLKIYSCMADDPSTIQCSPDGILSKCENYIYQHTVGTIDEGITDINEMRWWRQRTSYEGCEECPLYPSCDRLLKNCPGKREKCLPEDKELRINRYHDLMYAKYEQWRKDKGLDDRQSH